MPEQKIRFEPKVDKIIEVILYLARCKDIELDIYKAVKLVYLADVLHLNRYGRPLTYDQMMAMKYGPVPSTTYSVLKKDRRLRSVDYDSLPFEFIVRGDRTYIEHPKRKVNEKLLSKSDMKVLEETVREYGRKSFRQLYDLTHEHEGYKRAWAKKGGRKSSPIHFEDLIDNSETKAERVDNLRATCRHVH